MRVVDVDMSLEKNILIGMIMSTSFLNKIVPIFNIDYFDMSASSVVTKWILDYYGRYNVAPQAHIQTVFDEKGKGLPDADYEWTKSFLGELNAEYKRQGFNEQYLFDQTLSHFKKQHMKKSCNRIQDLLDDDKIGEAETIWLDSMKISADVDMGIDPFADETVKKLTKKEVRFLFTFGIPPFDMLAGKQKSEWLIILMAPMKRGKTLGLSHLAVHNALSGHNVVFISLESGYQDIAQRFWMNVGSLVSIKNGKVEFPRFRSGNSNDVKAETEKRPLITDIKEVRKLVGKFRKICKGRLMIKSFPAYSAGLPEIETYLDALMIHKNFTPHLIVIDYLGAMKSPKGVFGRDVYDHNSRGLKGMSQARHALVATGHQGSRKTLDKLNMQATDVPEDVRILANVDAIYGLDQTEAEKDENIIRMNVLMHRFRKFSRKKQVMILQQPEAGQFHIDSRMIDAPVIKDKLDSKKKEKENLEEENDNDN